MRVECAVGQAYLGHVSLEPESRSALPKTVCIGRGREAAPQRKIKVLFPERGGGWILGKQKGDVYCNQENFGTFMLESQAPPTGMMRKGRWSGQQGRSRGPAGRPQER